MKNELKTMKKIDLLITHKNCADGTGAAMAVKKYADENDFDMVQMEVCQYGTDFEYLVDLVEDRYVLVADFSFDRELMLRMKESAAELVVIDHHKTAEANLKGLDFCHFDMSKSGAVLTWEYLFPEKEVPKILKHIQDRDIWKWELEYSKEFSAGFQLCSQMEVIEMDHEYFFTEKFLDECIVSGKSILEYQESIVNKQEKALLKNPLLFDFDGHQVPCTNNNHLISEIGNMASNHYPFSVQYFFTEDSIVFSLRSIGDKFDVAELCKRGGGGGHKNAAGMSFKLEEFDLNKFFTTRKFRAFV